MKNLTQKLIITAFAALFSLSVSAADIGSLKNQGIIGENAKGYLELVASSASNEAKDLVTSVNQRRKSIYQQQAKKNNLSLAEVEAIAAKRNLAKTKSGHYIKPAGSWVKK